MKKKEFLVERLPQVARERGYQVVALIAEQASSLNEKCKGMKKLLTLIDQQPLIWSSSKILIGSCALVLATSKRRFVGGRYA